MADGTDRMYLVMEMVEGPTLKEVIDAAIERKDGLSDEMIWDIFIQLCTALRYMHKHMQIVHRDLKPANLMLDWEDRLKVADFGLARAKQTQASLMQSYVGSMQYSCPEIVQHQPYSSNMDIWAAGCILYELAVLKPCFPSSNPVGLARQICEGKYTRLTGTQPLAHEIFRLFCLHGFFNKVVSAHKCVYPYKYRRILRLLLKLTKLCAIPWSRARHADDRNGGLLPHYGQQKAA